MTTDAELYSALKYRVVDDFGTRSYHNAAGKLHREEGPAVIFPSGRKEWYRNGLRHRTDGPAIVHANGGQEWWHNGQPHRVNGPAIEWENGHKEWWINDVPYTEQQYLAKIKALGHTS